MNAPALDSRRRFLNACRAQPVDRPPVWLMRQAGRYMAAYQKLRQRYSFMDLCKIPEAALEVTMQPIHAFGMDAAIIFSDILMPLEAMGLPLQFTEAGPRFEWAVKDSSDLSRLRVPDAGKDLGYVAQAMRLVRKELGEEKALLGFAGSPMTLFAYAAEGGSSHHFNRARAMMYSNPDLVHALLDRLTPLITDHLLMQIEAGADAVQIFSSHADLFPVEHYRRFNLPYLNAIVEAVAKTGKPVILFARGTWSLLESMLESRPQAVSADWRVGLAEYRAALPASVAVQGNFDPAMLFAAPFRVREEMTRAFNSLDGDPHGLIINLGHGVLPGTPEENVAEFVRAVKEYPWKAAGSRHETV